MTTTAVVPGLQRLRDSVQAEVLAGLPDHLQRLRWNREQIDEYQAQHLRALLMVARERSPFHQRRLEDVDVTGFRLADLASLPVMTKAGMMASLDDVYTDRRVSRELVERALEQTRSEPHPILGEYTALASGGSSGRRGLFVFDTEAWAGFVSSVTRSLIARLRIQGGAPAGGLQIAMVCAPSAVHATGSAAAWTAGGRLPIRYIPVPATLPVEEIVMRLNALQAPALCGYPSVLARLAAERKAGRLHISPVSVSTTSETLVPELRSTIAEGFEAPIIDTYGSSEGLVGTTPPDDDVLVFNSDMCILELVDADDHPVPHGVPSAKVLITNLYNRIQPLIRYELGDSLVRQPDSLDHGHVRATVRGRAGVVFQYMGVGVHPLVIDDALQRCPGILDYQARQTPRGVDVDALATIPVDVDRLTTLLAQALFAAGLRDAAVRVRIVDRLERHLDTGKIRRFVSL